MFGNSSQDEDNRDDERRSVSENAYIGKTLDEAVELAKSNKKICRVKSIDGVGQTLTMDFNFSRINFHLEDGIVTSVTSG